MQIAGGAAIPFPNKNAFLAKNTIEFKYTKFPIAFSQTLYYNSHVAKLSFAAPNGIWGISTDGSAQRSHR